MRFSPVLAAVALAAVLSVLLLIGPCRDEPSGRQAAADSLDQVADSIAREARDDLAADSAASDSAARATDSVDAVSGSLADSLKDLDRVDSVLRARGPVRVARETRRQAPPEEPEAIAVDTAPAQPGFNPDDPVDQYVAEEESYSPCASTDDACWTALDSIVKADSVAVPASTPVTPSDSIVWLLAIDANNTRRIANLRGQLANEKTSRAIVEEDRERWKRRALILGRQVEDLRSTTHAATTLVESPKLDLGIVKIPRPCFGAGPGATVGVASNGEGTGFGVAAGITVAAIFPFSGGCAN